MSGADDDDERDATDELLATHGGALEFISNKAVFNACLNVDRSRMLITEGCDAVFSVTLGKRFVALLIAELQALHDQMNEQPTPQTAAEYAAARNLCAPDGTWHADDCPGFSGSPCLRKGLASAPS